MSGTASLPVTVEIGFGAGPMDTTVTWTDVSAHVQRSKTIACNRGVDPATLLPADGRGQLRLRNQAGDFTPGRTGAYGLVCNRLPVRIKQGSTVLWTGLVEKWTSGVDGIRPVVDATLVDRWPRMRSRVLTGDRIQQVCQMLGAGDLWPLTDPAGSSRAENLLRDDAPLGTFWGDPLAPTDWGSATNPQGATLTPVLKTSGSSVTIATGRTAATSWPDGNITLSAWVQCTSAAASGVKLKVGEGIGLGDTFNVWILRDQVKVLVWGSTPITDVVGVPNSTGWRHIAAVLSTTTHDITTYLDGVEIHNRAGMPAGWAPSRRIEVAMTDSPAVAYLATWDRSLDATEVAAIHGAGVDGLGSTGQTPDARSALVAALWPPTTLTSQGTFTATMSKQAIDGVPQADLLSACATTEGGMLHLSPSGWPVLSSRAYRSGAAVAATIPAAAIETSAQWELDDTQIVNVSTVERMALGESVTMVSRRNDASVALYGEANSSVQGWWDTDVQAVDRANSQVTMWADPSPRSKSFTVDLMTCGAAISATILLAVDIGSRILLTGLPSQTPTQTAAGWYVDGIEDQITEATWKRTFTVSPAIDFLVLDDATFGGLDEWPLG